MRLCTVDGCDRKHYGKGLCNAHYQRALKEKHLGRPLRHNRRNGEAARRDGQGRKFCVDCKEWLSVDAFSTHGATQDRLQVYCRPCYYARHQFRKYRLTVDDVNGLLRQQCNECAVCGKDIAARYVVDHDHSCCPDNRRTCGRCVRGLLCDGCNLGLGSFQDSVVALRAAITYLEAQR